MTLRKMCVTEQRLPFNGNAAAKAQTKQKV